MRILVSLVSLSLMLVGCVKGQKCTDGVITKRFVHKYGVELAEKDWESRGSDGQIVMVMADGTRVTKNYVNGNLHGESVYTFPYNETAMRIENYTNGRLESVVFNVPSGHPEKEEIYTSPKSRTVTFWYDNMIPKSIEEFVDDKIVKGEYFTHNGQLESQVSEGKGMRTIRDRYGDLQYTETIDCGEMILCTNYHSNGTPKIQTPYRNGSISGERKYFLPSGEPELIEQWENHEKHGIATLFQNGEKVAEIPFVHHIKDGVEKRFRNGTELIQEITWKNGSKHGPSHLYVDQIVHTEWYFHGNQITRKAYEQMKQKEIIAAKDEKNP